jgi:hypothetical protein
MPLQHRRLTPVRQPRSLPVIALGLALSLLLAAAACGDATGSIARFDTVTYKSSPFALNGTPIGAVNAINTATALTVRADVGYDFDVAFDLDQAGRPVFITQRAVGSPQGTTGRLVALQSLPGAFDDVRVAPASGWMPDSIYTAAIGEVVGVRAGIVACQFELSPYIYSKMVVDSVSLSERRLWLTVVTDPNCGFRSFEPGRPRR